MGKKFHLRDLLEFTREEREFCFTLKHALLTPGSFKGRFIELLPKGWDLGKYPRLDVYVEVAAIRDLVNKDPSISLKVERWMKFAKPDMLLVFRSAKNRGGLPTKFVLIEAKYDSRYDPVQAQRLSEIVSVWKALFDDVKKAFDAKPKNFMQVYLSKDPLADSELKRGGFDQQITWQGIAAKVKGSQLDKFTKKLLLRNLQKN